MKSNIVRFPLVGEDILTFIEREGGVTTTRNVAGRFGWPLAYARRRLRELETRGVVSSKLKPSPDGSSRGVMLQWAIIDK